MSRQQLIERILRQALNPLHLEVTDESDQHNVPAGAQSHFKVLVVSDTFSGERLVQRHRRINQLLSGEFRQGLHALALHTWTPQEWYEKGGSTPESPECRGGSKPD